MPTTQALAGPNLPPLVYKPGHRTYIVRLIFKPETEC